MKYLYRILSLTTITLIGWLSIPILFHLMIKINIIDTELAPAGFANTMMQNTILIWIAGIALGIISIFIQQKWRLALLLCPIILPTIFAITYAIMAL